jgi:hypothetical protein
MSLLSFLQSIPLSSLIVTQTTLSPSDSSMGVGGDGGGGSGGGGNLATAIVVSHLQQSTANESLEQQPKQNRRLVDDFNGGEVRAAKGSSVRAAAEAESLSVAVLTLSTASATISSTPFRLSSIPHSSGM